ncbi:Phosphate metabolism protein 7 [Smittium culicis]|uniref:Phosphate metabolism protein 7 n=1 Tax=Smittium culicis TaxID=133412 RepID=A0A1R1YCJ4_9FUNG|nr:Phosphate metabolism protein 7 [Smittium culicis]
MDTQDIIKSRKITSKEFIYALALNTAIGLSLFLAFCLIRPLAKRIYASRTYFVNELKRAPVLKRGLFSWIIPTLKITDKDILKLTNLDSYMILRTIRFQMIFFAIASVITLSSLLPINLKNSSSTDDLSNLSASPLERGSPLLWAHFSVYIVSIFIILFFLYRESFLFIKLRQEYLIDPEYTSSSKAHTIMVCGLDGELANESKLKSIFSALPGKIKKVTINRDASELEKIIKKRDKAVQNLEVALTKYIILCKMHHQKFFAQKHLSRLHSLKNYSIFPKKNSIEPTSPPNRIRQSSGNVTVVDHNTDSIQLTAPPLPTMSIRAPKNTSNNNKTLENIKSLCSKVKVNKIQHFSEKLLKYNKLIKDFRLNKLSTLEKKSSGFVTFSNQISAHLAIQSLIYHKQISISPKFIDTDPTNVMWNNLNLKPYDRKIRKTISIIITIFIVIAWSSITVFIISFVNSDAFLNFLGVTDSLTSFLNKIKGYLAPLLIALLVSLLPIFLRFLVDLEGTVRKSDIETSVCIRYFMFLAFTVFILPTFASSFNLLWDNFAKLYQNPSSILSDMNNIILHSNSFFINYVMLRAFSSTALHLLQLPSLFIRSIQPWIFAISPRQRYMAEIPTKYDWSGMVPQHMLIFLIGTTYSALAPLINIFCFLYYLFNYLIYHYHFLYTFDDDDFSLGGTTYRVALQQIFSSLYMIESIWLIMMIVNTGLNKNSIIRLVLSIIIIVLTVAFERHVWKTFDPLFKFLPLSLAPDTSKEENKALLNTNTFEANSEFSDDFELVEKIASNYSIYQSQNKVTNANMFSSLSKKLKLDTHLSAFKPTNPFRALSSKKSRLNKESIQSTSSGDNISKPGSEINKLDKRSDYISSDHLNNPIARNIDTFHISIGDREDSINMEMDNINNTNSPPIVNIIRNSCEPLVNNYSINQEESINYDPWIQDKTRNSEHSHSNEIVNIPNDSSIKQPDNHIPSTSLQIITNDPLNTNNDLSNSSLAGTSKNAAEIDPQSATIIPRIAEENICDRPISPIHNLFKKTFIHPALMANSYSAVWVPEDPTGLSSDAINLVNSIGEGYFNILMEGAFINKRNRVVIDFDFDFGKYNLDSL